MPRRSKGPRLWLQPARRAPDGKIIERPVWVIRDGGHKHSTRCGESEAEAAQIALARYIIDKTEAPRERNRDPTECRIADVVAIYADDVVPKHARPKETAARLEQILNFFATKSLADLNRRTCKAYVKSRGKVQAARRELEDLRAAIRHHWEEGLCRGLVPVVLPEKSVPRERWLTRDEAARLLWAAWRIRQNVFGNSTGPFIGRHLARFILVGLYTGTRAGAICGAALVPAEGRGHIDVERGVFYRRAEGERETKKRKPPVRLPPRLAAHIERWKRLGIAKSAVVEWRGKPVNTVGQSFRQACATAGLGSDVVCHTLRHTCATWLMQSGADKWEVAGFLGMTVEMLEAHYGHHHPDYQSSAVNALSRSPRQKPDRLKGAKREQTSSNVVKLHGKR